jgi:hypothetical protein
VEHVHLVTRESVNWGYILEGPRRPARAKQLAAMRVFGVDVTEHGALWGDKIDIGSTRPRSQLTGREDLLCAVLPGDTVIIATPYCVGLSEKDATWFLAELGRRGVAAIVNGDIAKIEPGGDASEVIAGVIRAQHAEATARTRAKKRETQ